MAFKAIGKFVKARLGGDSAPTPENFSSDSEAPRGDGQDGGIGPDPRFLVAAAILIFTAGVSVGRSLARRGSPPNASAPVEASVADVGFATPTITCGAADTTTRSEDPNGSPNSQSIGGTTKSNAASCAAHDQEAAPSSVACARDITTADTVAGGEAPATSIVLSGAEQGALNVEEAHPPLSPAQILLEPQATSASRSAFQYVGLGMTPGEISVGLDVAAAADEPPHPGPPRNFSLRRSGWPSYGDTGMVDSDDEDLDRVLSNVSSCSGLF